jgi:hypothetical protein
MARLGTAHDSEEQDVLRQAEAVLAGGGGEAGARRAAGGVDLRWSVAVLASYREAMLSSRGQVPQRGLKAMTTPTQVMPTGEDWSVLPAPAPSVIMLDEAEDHDLEENRFLRAPLLLLAIADPGAVRVLNGPPWEESSTVIAELSARYMPTTGVWLGLGCYVTSGDRVQVRVQMPRCFQMRMRVPRSSQREDETPERARERLENILGRRGGYVRMWNEVKDKLDVIMDVRFAEYPAMLQMLGRMTHKVEIVAVSHRMRASVP